MAAMHIASIMYLIWLSRQHVNNATTGNHITVVLIFIKLMYD